MDSAKRLNWAAWGISLAAAGLAVVVWGQALDWRVIGISSYKLFPLLGLLAFSLMWSHYIASALRRHFGLDKSVLAKYFEVTSLVVLLAIVLHPGLLIWQLWRDGLGLPPGSYLQNYVAPALRWAAALGSVSWLAFIAYEFRRKFGTRKWWRFVQYASDAAMLGIFFHALNLGSHLQSGWYQYVWYFYGITLVATLLYSYGPFTRSRK